MIKIGGDVTTLQAGDRVVLQPNSFCEDCDDCDKYKSINSTHCQNWSTFGIHSDGAMAEYAKFKAKVSDEVAMERPNYFAIQIFTIQWISIVLGRCRF